MRAPGMQVLTDQIKAKRPGVTIGGIGDEDHQDHTSGHNEDDTPGVSAEDQDSDSVREHRAIDVMLGPNFSSSDGDKLVADLVNNAANRARMLYVNWGNTQWARSNGWQPRDNSDDPHGHVHVSGEADADANVNPWVLSDWGVSMAVHEDQMTLALNRLTTIFNGADADTSSTGSNFNMPNQLKAQLSGMDAKLDELQEGAPVTLTPEQLQELAAAVAALLPTQEQLRTLIREEIAKTTLS